MAHTNYNLIKFIRRCIYQMKREYGGSITLYTLGAVSTDYETGVKAATHTSYPIDRAVVLPDRIKREVIQTISMISANKKFVQGGTFETGTRTFIIDRRDVPTVTEINNEDWIVYDGKRYELKWIDEFEQGTAWLVIGKQLVGHEVGEDAPGVAGSSVTFTDVAVATYSSGLERFVTSTLNLSDVGEVELPLLRTNGGKADGTFDPAMVLSGGAAIQWTLGDGNTNTANSISHTYSANGNYQVTTNASPTLVTSLSGFRDGITELNIPTDWTNLEILYMSDNLLTSFETSSAWTSLEHIDVSDNPSLGTFNTSAAWTSLNYINCNDSGITALTLRPEWTLFATLGASGNNLTDLTFYSAWTSINLVYVQNNSLTAAVIDAMLIAVDATGATNGSMDYSSNPGSSDGSRSGAALTAKNNLVTNGWSITI